MTVYFISRHPGARQWARQEGLAVDRMLTHLEADRIAPGDVVIGALPVHLAHEVCRRGARYLHLTLELNPEQRGTELSADDMRRHRARLHEYTIRSVQPHEQSV